MENGGMSLGTVVSFKKEQLNPVAAARGVCDEYGIGKYSQVYI